MGSGSYGGGGGGTAYGGGGGGFGGGLRGYRFNGRLPVLTSGSDKKTFNAAKRCFRKLSQNSRPYLLHQFCSPMLRDIFEQVLLIPAPVVRGGSWDFMRERYGVANGRGCLREWAEVIANNSEGKEPLSKVRETARICVEDFLVKAVGDDIDIYMNGDSSTVLASLRAEVFDRASNYFLGALIWRLLEREAESLPLEDEAEVRNVAQKIADGIVDSFEHKFYAKNQVTHRDIFRIFSEKPDWLLEQLRK